MGPQVLPHVPGLCEGLGADWAGVFPLPCVSRCVSRQVRFLHEGLGTKLTHKLLLTQVASHVILIHGVRSESFLTVKTLTFLLPGMQRYVLLHVGFLSKSFPTECTEKSLSEDGVFTQLVISQGGGSELGLVTLVTPVILCPCVMSHVQIKTILTFQSFTTNRACVS